jgi:hypothetical protein
MRANVWSLSLAIFTLALGAVAERNLYDPRIHRWELTLVTALVCLYLIVSAARSIRPARAEEGFAAIGALGGAVICIAFVVAELLVGPPQRIEAAPGQVYRPPHSSSLSIRFPTVTAQSLSRDPPTSVTVTWDGSSARLMEGGTLRVHSYLLQAARWPAAHISAWSRRHVGQTVTQPNGVAFVSPVLLFTDLDTDGFPVDSFDVPALHREVRVKYYPGLPARGIDVPFLQLQINEENGGALYSGVTISGRQLRAAGMILVFTLGSYPLVTMAPVPDEFMFIAGALVVGIGVFGFIAMVVRQAVRRGPA